MFRSTSLIICTGLVLSLCAFKRAAGSSEQAKAGMPMSMPLVAPLFLQGNGYESSLTIINELTKAVNGIVIARAADGSELGRKAIQFGPHSQTIVAVSELLTNATGGATNGSIELVPDPMVAMDMPIAAQLSIVSNRTMPTTYLEEEFISVDAHLASRYRAVAPSAVGSPTVALLSTSMSQQHVEIRCLGEHAPKTSRSVELQANQMQLVPACDGQGTLDTLQDDIGSAVQPPKNAAAIALDISTNASPGSLAVWGVSAVGREHKTKVALNFTNAAASRSKDTIFAGVPVGRADLFPGEVFKPALAVANYGTKPATVSVSYSSMVADAPQMRKVAAVSLAPESVQHISLPDLGGDP